MYSAKWRAMIVLAGCWFVQAFMPVWAVEEKGLASAEGWLMQVAEAMRSVSYEGEVVYTSGGKMMSYAVSHMAGAEMALQKISALGEGAREIIRNEEQVACYLPDKKMGVSEKRKAFQPLLLDHDLQKFSQHYRAALLGRASVADRPCQEIEITPRDVYRYGYFWCVDVETFLPLKSELRGVENGTLTPLESQMFVKVRFLAAEGMPAMRAKTADSALAWQREEAMPDKPSQASDFTDRVAAQMVAHGFELLHSLKRASPALNKKLQHLVYSDGLARVSVFVIPTDSAQAGQAFELPMGAISSASRQRGDVKILVMGEVPMATAKAIAENFAEI